MTTHPNQSCCEKCQSLPPPAHYSMTWPPYCTNKDCPCHQASEVPQGGGADHGYHPTILPVGQVSVSEMNEKRDPDCCQGSREHYERVHAPLLAKDKDAPIHPQTDQGKWEEEFDERIASAKENLGGIPEPTCPQIDKVLSALDDVARLTKKAERNYESVVELAKDVDWAMPNPQILEDLRDENAKLRDLGQAWYEECRDLKSFITIAIAQEREKARREELEWVSEKINQFQCTAANPERIGGWMTHHVAVKGAIQDRLASLTRNQDKQDK